MASNFSDALNWDLVWLGGRFSLVLAAAILAVLVLRAPARRVFGARVAYALWLIPPLAATMCFAPLRVEHIVLPAEAFSFTPPAPAPEALQGAAPSPTLPALLFMVWAGGVLLHLAVLALRQRRFVGALGRLAPRHDLGARVFAAQSAAHGPAVIGVLRPIIVTPADFERRFSADEQRIVLAHERAHMAQGDPLINAGAALLQCLNWFNPLVHMAARALRVDQELACDAAVLARAESARRPYAETILKTQIAQAPVPLGCAWPSPSPTSLKERIAMLKRTLPSRRQTLLGAAVIFGTALVACAVAWSAQPTRLVVTTAEPEAQTLAADAHRLQKLARARAGMLSPVELASIELDGGPNVSDAQDNSAGGDPENDDQNSGWSMNHDDHNGRVHISGHSDIFSDQEIREINDRGTLTTDQQRRLDDYIHVHVERAMRNVQAAMERTSAVREREIQESVRIATREATRHAAAASRHYSNYEMSPELRAEVAALSEAVSRLTTRQIQWRMDASEDRPDLAAERAEVRRHADRIRELAQRAHGVDSEDLDDDADSSDDGDNSDDNSGDDPSNNQSDHDTHHSHQQ